MSHQPIGKELGGVTFPIVSNSPSCVQRPRTVSGDVFSKHAAPYLKCKDGSFGNSKPRTVNGQQKTEDLLSDLLQCSLRVDAYMSPESRKEGTFLPLYAELKKYSENRRGKKRRSNVIGKKRLPVLRRPRTVPNKRKRPDAFILQRAPGVPTKGLSPPKAQMLPFTSPGKRSDR